MTIDEQKKKFRRVLSRRIPFIYTFSDWLNYKVSFICPCFFPKNKRLVVKYNYYLRTKEKIAKEIDIVQVVKRIRKFNIMK
jgi:hypothetical protein